MSKLSSKLLALAIISIATIDATLGNSELTTRLNASRYIEDGHLTPRELIAKYGYRGETHEVITEDGYILEMHRITGSNSDPDPVGKQPVLLLHGFLSSSVDWIITGPGKAFGYILADERYDVWMGNSRGNIFSRKHKKYSTRSKKYWQFTWHENGISDIPAMIDYILAKTGWQQLIYIGHSQGTAAFWVTATERPEYQKKVKAMFALGPIAYLTHTESLLFQFLGKTSNIVESIWNLIGLHEFKPTNKLLQQIIPVVCDEESVAQPICTNILFMIAGPVQVNETMLPAILGHVPAGASSKQLVHYGQLLKARKFQQYDHGMIMNLIKYKQVRPPVYDLSKIKIPVSLHHAANDWVSNRKDVDRLYKELGNPIGKFRVPLDKFGHLDFQWANDAKKLLYDKLIGLMKQFRE